MSILISFVAFSQWIGVAECAESAVRFKVLGTTAFHSDAPLISMAMSWQTGHIAVGTRAGRILVWDLATGHEVASLEPIELAAARSLAFSPDNQTLAGDFSKTIEIWDLGTWKRMSEFHPYGSGKRTYYGPSSLNDRMMYTPLGLAVAGWIFNPKTGERLKQYGPPSPLAVSPTGLLASWGKTNLEPFRITDLDSFAVRELYDRWPSLLRATPSSFDFTSDGKRLAVGYYSTGGGAAIVDFGNLHDLHRMKDSAGWIMDVAFSPDEKLLAGAAWHGGIYLWDAKTGSVVRALGTPDRNNLALAFAADGKSIWAIGTDHTVRVWSVPDGRPLHRDDGHRYGVKALSVSSNGKLIASIDSNRAVHLWNSESGKRVAVLPRAPNLPTADPLFSLSFSLDDKQLAVSGSVTPNTGEPADFMAAAEAGFGKIQVFDVARAALTSTHIVHPFHVERAINEEP